MIIGFLINIYTELKTMPISELVTKLVKKYQSDLENPGQGD